MNPKVSRRQILEQVRRGELSVADATALLGGPAAGRPSGGDDVVCFRPVWEYGGEVRPAPVAASRALVILDCAAQPEAPGVAAPTGAITVHAVRGGGWVRQSDTRFRVGVDADSGFTRLWEELTAQGRMPERVVVVTEAAPEHCLDVAYPLVRALIRHPHPDRPEVVFLPVGAHAAQSGDALGGFCAVAVREDSRLHAVCVTTGYADPDPVGRALAEPAQAAPGSAQVRYDNEGRRMRTLVPVELPQDAGSAVAWLPDRGVYLLTGGAGGIGLRIAELLARQSRARLVLMGRSALDASRREALARIEAAGGRVTYAQGDVTRREDVASAVALAHAAYGPLTGVLHLAGVNEDAYIVNKAPAAHHRVLDPKIVGARHLDEATRHEPLRFFALFSSMSGHLGHPGQSDYAAAARALGGFAAHRASQVEAGERRGATVSLGWPLWEGGGMTLSENDRLATEELQGMTAMPAETGLAVLTAAVRSGLPELVVVHGRAARIRAFAAGRTGPGGPGRPAGDPGTPADAFDAAARPRTEAAGGAITEAAQAFLVDLVAKLAGIPAGQLRPDQEFSALGIDSVMIKRLSVALEDRFGPLPVTLLFEHRSVAELARHLAEHHPEALREPTADRAGERREAPRRQTPEPVAAPATAPVEAQPEDAIAIVGIAGRYPGAADPDALWQALVEGRDCTGEIPADRWDKDRWFDSGDRRPGTSYGRWGGFLSDVTRFDSLFFGVSPREAVRMDPAERLFLEVAWSAIEDAGYTRARLHRHTRTEEGHALGVFVGTTGMAYELVAAEEWGKGNPVSAYSMEFSLANRLSYFLDAHGPSLVVDTACSASLTALHLACESLRRGECRMAVAGGAYLNLHPMKFAMLSEQRMISPDGVGRAFGEGGNGFVPGEGVGAVLLKPLGAALADGDHVHAVIRSTAVSHGGRTNGYTVPSPKSHASVIRTALRRAGVDARTIGYVEAHGTGTELGDPIEIDGLTRAFGDRSDDHRHCALGSVKSNIGHAEAAAGIAGLTKVVLQLRHRTLVPTLHSEPANSRIDFASSPFRLQRAVEPWRPTSAGLPLRAALSSFGAGGANAHLIVEEFTGAPHHRDTGGGHGSAPAEDSGHLILLSARTEERLAAMADRLARHDGAGLRDIAHTLQVGREHLEHRLALIVRDRGELRERLARFAGTGAAEGVLTGRAAPDAALRTDDGPERTRSLFAARRWRELAELWVTGAEIDWDDAHRAAPAAGPAPHVVPLPGYPFSGPSHWPATLPAALPAALDAAPTAARTAAPGPVAALGPHTSTAGTASFPVLLGTRDRVAADHLVAGRPVLAGVAHLELARAAAHALTGRQVVELTGVQWRVPLVLDGTGAAVRVTTAADAADVALVTDGPEGTTVHSTLTARLDGGAAPRPRPLDLAGIRARCAAPRSGETFYERAAAEGLAYGPSYRLVRRLWSGDGEALAELAEQPAGTAAGWWLEPGVADAALHTLHGAVPAWDRPATLPASVDRVRLHAPTGPARWAYARLTAADAERGSVRCEVTLCDAQGQPLVEFTGFTAVRAPGASPTARVPYYRPTWRLTPLDAARVARVARGQDGPVLILTTEHDHGLGAALAERHGGRAHLIDLTATAADRATAFAELLRSHPVPAAVYFLGGVEQRRYTPTDLDHLEDAQSQGCLALFHLARALAEHRPRGTRLTVLTSDAQQVDEDMPLAHPFAASLHGLTRTVARELAFLDTVCIDLAGEDLARCAELGRWEALLDAIEAEPALTPFAEVALREGARMVKRLEPAEPGEPVPGTLPLRDGGRYLLLGGAGGLGQVIAGHLARTYGARLMLVGRRPADALPEGLLASLREAGAEVEYHCGDITDPAAVRACVAWMRQRFGGVDGVIHTAFRLADRTLARMDESTFRAALDPKVRGTVALCDALGSQPLDFLALFSSAIAHTGNPGQANYAAGSTFLAAYGRSLAGRLHWPVTVFDWGFWGDQGAVATEEHRRRLADWGILPLSAAEGVRAFRACLAAGAVQLAPLKADGSLADVTPVATDTLQRAEPAVPAAPARVLAPVRAAVREAQAAYGEPYAPDYLDAVDAYGRRRIREVLAVLDGLAGPAGHAPAGPSGTPDTRQRLYEALLAAGRSGPGAETADVTAQRAELVRRFPESVPTLDLLDDCAAALPDVLAGRRRGLDVLFPGGSGHRIAALYHEDPRTRYFNTLCAAAVTAAARHRLDGRPAEAGPLRILEIGAGTGGTSLPVLDALGALASTGTGLRYDCTDISPTLVAAGREGFGAARRFAEFKVLDISGDLRAQGFANERYDIVLATNVLHATADIRRTLANVADLMAPGALLVLNEATRVLDSITAVFGLTDGWWLARDPELRLPHSPLVGPGTWSGLLTEAGLNGVSRHGVPGRTAEQDGQQLILAERGVWRRVTPADGAGRAPAARSAAAAHPASGSTAPSDQASGTADATARTADGATRPAVAPAAGAPPAGPETESLIARTAAHLTAVFAGILRLPEPEIDQTTPLSAYGADSLSTMEAAEQLERVLGPVPREVLFAGDTVRGIAEQLVERGGATPAALPPNEAGPASAPDRTATGAEAAAPERATGPRATVPAEVTEPARATGPAPEPGPADRPAGRPAGSAAPAEPIAVVGVAGRYPQARELDTFWANLRSGRRAVTDVPEDRWPLAEHHDPSGTDPDRSYHRWGAFLDDVDRFDPLLFRISPREAETMDPAQRLVLETAWEALEDAGWPPSRLRSAAAPGMPRVGVFVGVMHAQYQLLAAEQWGRGRRLRANSSGWAIANRVSHCFGLTGPSMAVDTACSSSLTALHLAVRSLRSGECSAALTGGVNLILHPSHHLDLSAARMLSRDGHGRAFDTAADGMVTGEGAGVVLLKRLSDALRDGDRIHACVLGTAVNADGPTDGFAVPGVEAQVALIQEALRDAGADAGSVQYVEAQATGSPVGDPVELAALRRAYDVGGTRRTLTIGSLKPGIGHLEAASGMAQLTKVLLQLRHDALAPTLGTDGPATADGFRVVREPADWRREPGGPPRRAAVSSFGAGGANAHVILEEAPPAVRPAQEDSAPQLLVLSARRPDRLKEHARRMAEFLHSGADRLRLDDVAYTLQTGREPLPARLALVAHSVGDAAEALRAFAQGDAAGSDRVRTGTVPRAPHPGPTAPPVEPQVPGEAGLAALARGWTAGGQADWQALWAGRTPRLVTLPHYPFARDRYWLDAEPPATGPAAPDTAPSDYPEESYVTHPDPAPAADAAGPAAGRPAVPVPARDVRPDIARTVTEVICELLHVKPSDIDLGDHLSDFGFDSVTMVHLADRLTAELGVPVSPAVLYGCPDVTALVRELGSAADHTTPAPATAPAPSAQTAPAHATGPARADTPAPLGDPADVPTSVETVAPVGATAPATPAAPAPSVSVTPAPTTAPAVAEAPVPAARTASAPAFAPAGGAPAEPVAVVGMAGAFPGSPDLETYWRNLAEGRDLITRAPADRFQGTSGTSGTSGTAGSAPYWGGFLDGVDLFDAGFFQITPREARVMDPQHRLFLQTVWSAVEEAGYDPAALAGSSCGLFVGVASSEYGELARERGAELDGQLMTGNDHSVLANRISFLLDLRGPSEPVDTACSSSLVALHRAVRAIQTGECELAIAGGVNVILSPTGFEAFDRSGMLAADGRCKSFDHRADGYVRGEGVGALLLKPLSRARADGDHIHALITGTATNHGGRSASLTAPNPAAQAAVIAAAQQRAGVRPQDIGYVEAHGTGTALGDPIEFTGLRTAFGAGERPDAATQFCGLGSVKTNIGHLETAAGIAGVIKVILGLRHRMLPPTLHLQQVNPLIELGGSPFYLVGRARRWDRPSGTAGQAARKPRRAGVSSFGFGGMNAHVIVEEPPAPAAAPAAADGPQLFVLSARDEDRLRACAQRLLDHLRRLEREGTLAHARPADTAYTLQTGRPALPVRLAAAAESHGELTRLLRAHLDGTSDTALWTGTVTTQPDTVRPDAEELAHAAERARSGDPARLAALWVRGARPDWAALHQGRPRYRVSLPGYPFAPESHWLPKPANPTPAQDPVQAAPRVRAVTMSVPDLPVTTPAPRRAPDPTAPAPARATAPAAHAVTPRTATPAPAPHSSDSDPLAALRRHVREAVADGIGISPEQVVPAREFSAYGVDSIGAMRIMQQIQARYGDHIPMAAILEHPSVDRLTAHLNENYVLPDVVPDAVPGDVAAAPAQARPETAIRLIPFGDGGDGGDGTGGTPSYCLFGDTGELTWLTHLHARLAEDGPVFGLEAPGFAEDADPAGGIAELGEWCAAVIAGHHTGGPCRVIGHGLAGLVAGETVRNLVSRGVEVAGLLLLGTPEPGDDTLPAEPVAVSVVEAASRFAAAWGAGHPVTGLPDGGLEEQLDAAVRELADRAPMSAPDLRRWLHTAVRWRSALAREAAAYRPQPVTGEVLVIRPAEPAAGAGATRGDFGRWIAPPPAVRELDCAAWALTAAGPSARIADLLAGSPASSASVPSPSPSPSAVAVSPVVPINRHGNGRRSVWAHNLYGEVSYAIYLSRHLGMRQPVIGLEQLGSGAGSGDARPKEYSSVEDMAAHYVSELRTGFPCEPYLLGGCSFGGVLAYEMARQLQAQGEEVSHLIAIDPIMPGTEAWDSVDWGTVTAVEAEAFSLVMLGNAMCQRWGVSEQIGLDSLTGFDLDKQLDLVARHIHERSPARPEEEMIKRQILVRHELMLRNGDLLQAYRPRPLLTPVPTTLFHATEGFLAAGNTNGLPAVPRTSTDTSNGFAGFVGDRLVIHELRADHHTIAHNENLARIARMLTPLLDRSGFPASLFPASLYPSSTNGSR